MLHNPRLLAILEILTVGLPFCIFKLLAGLLMGPWGLPLIVLSGSDAMVNLSNLATLVGLNRRVLPVCTFGILVPALPHFRNKDSAELSASLDVATSFLIVAIVIGGGFYGNLPPLNAKVWSLGVVLNVLGAGLFQVNQAYAKWK